MSITSIAVLIISFLVISWSARIPALILHRKFYKLGPLNGKSYEEISAVVGKPNMTVNTVNKEGIEVTEREWQATMFKLALHFDKNETCIGIARASKM